MSYPQPADSFLELNTAKMNLTYLWVWFFFFLGGDFSFLLFILLQVKNTQKTSFLVVSQSYCVR